MNTTLNKETFKADVKNYLKPFIEKLLTMQASSRFSMLLLMH